MLTDRIGTEVAVRGFDEAAYLAFREIYAAKGRAAESPDGEAPVIVRRGLQISADGASIRTRKGLTYTYNFYPWTQIDACEVETTCCGGKIFLITESGAKIVAYSACFWQQQALVEVLSRLRQMKYKREADAPGPDTITFAGKVGDPRACVLTAVSLRIAVQPAMCRRVVCVLDLDSVKGCQLIRGKGCFKKDAVVILVDKCMGTAMSIDDYLSAQAKEIKVKAEQQALIVFLRRSDNGQKIREEIIKRARIRIHEES